MSPESDDLKTRHAKIKALYTLRNGWIEDLRALNLQAAVFFATTTGCWSVPARVPRAFALFASLAFFSYSLFLIAEERKRKRSELAEIDAQELRSDKACGELYEYLNRDFNGFGGMFRKGWPYVIAMFFWLFSIWWNFEKEPNQMAESTGATAPVAHR
jgi:hypothetical protein